MCVWSIILPSEGLNITRGASYHPWLLLTSSLVFYLNHLEWNQDYIFVELKTAFAFLVFIGFFLSPFLFPSCGVWKSLEQHLCFIILVISWKSMTDVDIDEFRWIWSKYKTLPRKADASSFVVVHWLVGWVSFEVSKGGDGRDVDFSPSGIILLFLRKRMTRFILLAVWFEPMSKHTWTQDSRKRFQSFNTSGRLWWQIPFRPPMASIIIRLTCALLFLFLCKKWRRFLGWLIYLLYRYY